MHQNRPQKARPFMQDVMISLNREEQMDEEISRRLSDAIISSNRQYSMIIAEMKEKYPKEVYMLCILRNWPT